MRDLVPVKVELYEGDNSTYDVKDAIQVCDINDDRTVQIGVDVPKVWKAGGRLYLTFDLADLVRAVMQQAK